MGYLKRGIAAAFAEWAQGLAQIAVELPDHPSDYFGLHLQTLSLEEVSALLQAKGIMIPGHGEAFPSTVENIGESLQQAAVELDEADGPTVTQIGPFYLFKGAGNETIYSLSLDLGYIDSGLSEIGEGVEDE